MKGARRLYDKNGDMWFFELWHHLSDCYEALALRTDGERRDNGTPADNITVTPSMIEVGVIEAWPEPKPPTFIGDLVERIYRVMEQMRRIERQTEVDMENPTTPSERH